LQPTFSETKKQHFMKTRLFVTIVTLVICSSVSAQISFGVQAGAVLSKPSVKQTTDFGEIKPESKFGFSGGLIADVPFGDEPLRLMPELKFVQKGVKYDFSAEVFGQTFKLEGNSNINYIELPVNLAYAFNMGKNKLFLGAGPYAAVGLSGRSTGKSSVNGEPAEETDEKIEFGSDEDQTKKFDYGGNIMAGYFMNNGVMLKLNYSRGFANLSNEADSKFRNQYFGLTIAYFMNRGE
jgi:Outer membrane protein beta-barrel domain